jgi:formate dehydrogenase iron-sulfur subunit
MIMEGDPFVLIEGMAIAGLATGADQGYIYLRSEYPDAHVALERAIAVASEHHVLGPDILGSGHAFDLEVRLGAGAYVCGEETSLLDSLEGNRGVVRAKPPLPALQGLFGRPTVVNNVISLATVPVILDGAPSSIAISAWASSRGTHPDPDRRQCQAWRAVRARLRHLARRDRRRHRRRHALGPAGQGGAGRRAARRLFPARSSSTRPSITRRFAAIGTVLGHAGIVVFDDSVDMLGRPALPWSSAPRKLRQVHALPHRRDTRCRVRRSTRLRGEASSGRANLAVLRDLCKTMKYGSLCALGGFTPYAGDERAHPFLRDDFAARQRRSCRSRRNEDDIDEHCSRKSTTVRRPRDRREATVT